MQKRAQSSLEYLITYGWALILVTTVIGVLIFIMSTGMEQERFSSSDPTKIMIKGAAVNDGTATIKMQNITGGKIEINDLSSQGYENCEINGDQWVQGTKIVVGTGGEILIECDIIEGQDQGPIEIGYTDQTGLDRTVEIEGDGGGSTGTGGTANFSCSSSAPGEIALVSSSVLASAYQDLTNGSPSPVYGWTTKAGDLERNSIMLQNNTGGAIEITLIEGYISQDYCDGIAGTWQTWARLKQACEDGEFTGGVPWCVTCSSANRWIDISLAEWSYVSNWPEGGLWGTGLKVNGTVQKSMCTTGTTVSVSSGGTIELKDFFVVPMEDTGVQCSDFVGGNPPSQVKLTYLDQVAAQHSVVITCSGTPPTP